MLNIVAVLTQLSCVQTVQASTASLLCHDPVVLVAALTAARRDPINSSGNGWIPLLFALIERSTSFTHLQVHCWAAVKSH